MFHMNRMWLHWIERIISKLICIETIHLFFFSFLFFHVSLFFSFLAQCSQVISTFPILISSMRKMHVLFDWLCSGLSSVLAWRGNAALRSSSGGMYVLFNGLRRHQSTLQSLQPHQGEHNFIFLKLLSFYFLCAWWAKITGVISQPQEGYLMVRQFQYLGWAGHREVPASKRSFLKLILQVDQWQREGEEGEGRTIVHCLWVQTPAMVERISPLRLLKTFR